MKLYRSYCGPYGMGWWGISFKVFDNRVPRGKYDKIAYLTIALGTRNVHDGHQQTRVTRGFEWCLEYGKRPPVVKYTEEPDDELLGET